MAEHAGRSQKDSMLSCSSASKSRTHLICPATSSHRLGVLMRIVTASARRCCACIRRSGRSPSISAPATRHRAREEGPRQPPVLPRVWPRRTPTGEGIQALKAASACSWAPVRAPDGLYQAEPPRAGAVPARKARAEQWMCVCARVCDTSVAQVFLARKARAEQRVLKTSSPGRHGRAPRINQGCRKGEGRG